MSLLIVLFKIYFYGFIVAFITSCFEAYMDNDLEKYKEKETHPRTALLGSILFLSMFSWLSVYVALSLWRDRYKKGKLWKK